MLVNNTPNKMEISPEITIKFKDSPKINADETMPITGIPREPMEVFMAGNLAETVM